jgi:hypothetical protein
VDFHVALRDGGGAVGFGNVLDPGLDFGFAVKIDAPEAHAAVRGCGQNSHVNPVATVEADAGITGWTIQSLLIEHTKLDKTPARLASEHK